MKYLAADLNMKKLYELYMIKKNLVIGKIFKVKSEG